MLNRKGYKWFSVFVLVATLMSTLLLQPASANTQPPIISPGGGTFTSAQSVTLSNIPNGDTVYYTIDGSDPTISSTAITYDGTFTVSESETIKATVHDTVTGWSTVASAVFVINTQTLVQPPIISPNGGTFATAQTITLSNVPNTAIVYYTTDGSAPASSTTAVPYTGAFTVNQSETVLAAIHDAVSGWSTVASAVFVINNTDIQPGDSDQIAQLKQQFATAISNNQFKEAAKILQQIQFLVKQASSDDRLDKLKEQLISAVNSNNWGKAEAFLKQIVKLDGSDWAYCQLGQVYEQEGNDNVNVFSNGDQVDFDEQPIVVNGRTLIPIRQIANSLGLSDNNVSWDPNGTVTINNGSNTIIIRDNQSQVYLNGKAYTTDVPAQIRNGRMMVPLRTIGELFNKKVQWYPQGKIVTIK